MLIDGLDVEGRGLSVWGAVTACAGLWMVHAVVCVMVKQQGFGCIDGRVQLRAGVQVLSIQVHTPGISPTKQGNIFQHGQSTAEFLSNSTSEKTSQGSRL